MFYESWEGMEAWPTPLFKTSGFALLCFYIIDSRYFRVPDARAATRLVKTNVAAWDQY